MAAEIRWTGTAHHLKKVTPWGAMKVNGRDVTEHQLRERDELKVGGSRYVYVVRD